MKNVNGPFLVDIFNKFLFKTTTIILMDNLGINLEFNLKVYDDGEKSVLLHYLSFIFQLSPLCNTVYLYIQSWLLSIDELEG